MQITNKQIEYCKLCDDIKRQHRKRSVFFWALPKWVGDWNLRWGKLPLPSQRAQKSTGNTNPKLRWLFKHLSYEKYVLQSVRISAKVGREGENCYFGNALDIFLGWGSRIRDNRIRMFLDACLEKKKKTAFAPALCFGKLCCEFFWKIITEISVLFFGFHSALYYYNIIIVNQNKAHNSWNQQTKNGHRRSYHMKERSRFPVRPKT